MKDTTKKKGLKKRGGGYCILKYDDPDVEPEQGRQVARKKYSVSEFGRIERVAV